MKNTVKLFALIAAASVALLSCNKEAPSKAEVESGFTPVTQSLPTVTISNSGVVCDALSGIANVNITVTGLDTTLDSLEVGVLSSASEDFLTTKFAKVDNPADGTLTVPAIVTANKTYYLKAVVSSTIGSVFSDVISIDVPDIPFWAKIAGKWACSIESEAYGDEYDNVMTLMNNPDDPQNEVYVIHLEPYYNGRYGANYGYPDYFWCVATIDNDKNSFSIPVGATYHYVARSIVGLDSDSMNTATKYAPLVFSLVDDDTLLQVNAFQTFDGDEAEDSYIGNVVYTRQ